MFKRVLWVPASFDAPSMLQADMQDRADGAHYLLDLILRKRMKGAADADGFVPLHAQLLRKQLGHRVSLPLIRELERIEVIEKRTWPDGRAMYQVGRQCSRYRLLPPYATDAVRMVRLEDERIVKVHEEWRRERQCPKSGVHAFLDRWVQHTGIAVNPARRIIRQTPKLAQDAAIWFAAVDMITSRECPTSVCRMGRYHSIFTRIPRELRTCLVIDRQMEPLVSLDVSNCQPLLIGLIVGIYAAAGKPLRARLRKGSLFKRARAAPYRVVQGNKRNTGARGSPALILRADSGVLRQVDPATGIAPAPAFLKNDAVRYLELCEKGTIYDELRRALGMKSRDAVKDRFVKMAGKPDWSRRFDSGFAALFPSVTRVMKQIQKNDYRQLARLTQNVEATLVIDSAVRRLMQLRNPNMPILTVHDSIFTRPKFLPIVRDSLSDVFREIGLGVTLKSEQGTPGWRKSGWQYPISME